MKFLVFWTFAALFFILLYVLAWRDRSIVMRGLGDEVGRSLHPKEYKLTSSGWNLLPLFNLFTVMGSPGGYFAARKKQLALAELAFLKHRRRRGEAGQGLDNREADLRRTIDSANQRGVFVGKR